MNDRQASLNQMEDESRSSSPKRKKIRQKYAPKACVSCRRSKLKCTGENPCQRCIDNGKRCFFSEDETAAQVLQTLSRPTPTPHHVPSLTNGNGTPRRNILPRHGSIERRASDASVLGLSMETRMARIETMMEALLQDRGMTMTPLGSIEREESGSDGFRSENAFALPLLDPINPALAHMGQPAAAEDPMDWRRLASPHEPRTASTETSSIINLDGRTLPFPTLQEYHQYMRSFFCDIHLRYPCIEEDEFLARGERMVTERTVQASEILFLALNYTIFAICDVLSNVSSLDGRPRGWHWFQVSNDLVDKKALFEGPGDLLRIQLLLFNALYLTFADVPGMAYTTIGFATRLMLQYGMHQQQFFSHLETEQLYSHSCIFWNVFVTDRNISLSCGRPYSIRDSEIDLESPMDIFKKDLNYRVDQSFKKYINQYLNFRILLARRAGSIWDSIVDSNKSTQRLDRTDTSSFESKMKRFLANDFHKMHVPHTSGEQAKSHHKTAMILSNIVGGLWMRHRLVSSLQYDVARGHEFGTLALATLDRVRELASNEDAEASRHSITYRNHMVSSIASALRIFCALLVRDLSSSPLKPLEPRHHTYIKGFQEAVALLAGLKSQVDYAKRVLDDFGPLLSVVEPVVQKWLSSTPAQQSLEGFSLVKHLIPSNVAGLFPYRETTPNLHGESRTMTPSLSPGPGSNEWNSAEQVGAGRASILWLL